MPGPQPFDKTGSTPFGGDSGYTDNVRWSFPEMESLTSRDAAAVLRRVEALEFLMERSIMVPGTNRTIGIDALVGLVPVLGDIITATMGAYLVWEARNLGMSRFHLIRMAANVGIDSAIGAIPILGDTFDFFFRSNSRNLKIIKRHIHKYHPHLRVIEG